MPSDRKIGLGLLFLPKIHQTKLHFGLRAQGEYQKRERRRRQRNVDFRRCGLFYVAHHTYFTATVRKNSDATRTTERCSTSTAAFNRRMVASSILPESSCSASLSWGNFAKVCSRMTTAHWYGGK